MKNLIKKVVLDLGGKEVELTLDEAKKLHAALNELFEQKVVERHVHHHDQWQWNWPAITWTTPLTVSDPHVTPTTTQPIWYSSSGGVGSYSSFNDSLTLKI